jgi:SAM-dependent methyltransferase
MNKPPGAPKLFDHAALRARLARAERAGAETFLLEMVSSDLAERLGAVVRPLGRAADIGTPLGGLGDALAGRVGAVDRVDLLVSDNEDLRLAPQSIDLAVSALALQFANDLPGIFAQVRRALVPDGLFIAAMLGGDTLSELRQAFAAAESERDGGISPRVAPAIDVRDLGALLQRAGFALPVSDSDRLIVRYDDAFALMRDLRRMAATNVLTERRRTPLRRTTLVRMAEVYADRFSDPDGRIRATFDILWLSGWAPHESQQKPLRPGSAQASLADAVKNTKR